VPALRRIGRRGHNARMERVSSDMTAAQFEEARNTLALTQAQLARLVAVEPRTVRRSASGESEVPIGVAMILRLLIKYRVKPETAFKLATGEDW
jgi:DNA-binding transcriptional regulator YiaG